MKEKELENKLLMQIKEVCYNAFKEDKISIIGTLGIKISNDKIMLLSINENLPGHEYHETNDYIELSESDSDEGSLTMDDNHGNSYNLLPMVGNNEHDKNMLRNSCEYENNLGDNDTNHEINIPRNTFKSITESSNNSLLESNSKFCNHLSPNNRQEKVKKIMFIFIIISFLILST